MTASHRSEAADVVVIGSGGAGLVAALAGAVAGAEVVVIEKTSELGGTTVVSGGTTWIAANHCALAAGCPDSPAEGLAYLLAGGGDHLRRDLLEVFVDAGPRMLRFVEQYSPVRFSLGNDTDYHPELPGGKERARSVIPAPFDPAPLGSLAAQVRYVDLPVDIAEAYGSLNPPREPAGDGPPPWTRGRALVGGLLAGCLDHNVRFTTGARARQLLTGRGRVGGVRVEKDGGAYELTARRAVVLASGGFEWDEDLVAGFLPASISAPGSPPSMEGDGLRMAMALGAALGSMNEAWWSPMIQVPGEHYDGHAHSRMVVSQRLYPRSIMVNRSGRRFTNEAKSYHDVGRDLMAIDSEEGTCANRPAWLVYDAVYRRKYGTACIGPQEKDPSWLMPFLTLEALASHHGIDAAGLAATVHRFNVGVACGRDPLFHRGSSRYALSKGDRGQDGIQRTLGPIVEPPFYAVELHAGTIGTRGGPMTDVDGRVIDVWGAVIPGLFAAGNVAASPTGLMYPGAGGTLGLALTFGYLAGRAASLTMPDRREIAVLLARAAIRQELTAYLDAVMDHDWARVAQTFTPSATLDYGTPGVTGVEANIALLRAGVDLLTSKSTLLGMHADIDVSDDRARSEATTFTAHTPALGTDHRARMSIVVYVDEWCRDPDDRWRITDRVVHHRLRGWLDLL